MKMSFGWVSILGIIIVVGSIYYYANRDRMPDLVYQKSLALLKRQTIVHLSSESDVKKIENLFDRTLQKIHSENFDKKKWHDLKTIILDSLKDSKLDSIEIKYVLERVRKFVE